MTGSPAFPAGSVVASIAITHHRSLAEYRDRAGVLAARDGDLLWAAAPAELAGELLALPCVARYRLDSSSRLVPSGAELPIARMPPLDWRPIAEVLPVEMPVPRLAPRSLERASYRLTATDTVRPCGAIEAPFAVLFDWAIAATPARTSSLRYALRVEGDSDPTAFVIGEPLPSLPGRRFWIEERIAVPAGYEVSPRLPAVSLRRLFPFDFDSQDLAVLRTDGSWSWIEGRDLRRIHREDLYATRDSLGGAA